MKLEKNNITYPIPIPSWSGVRGIYQKLSEEFHTLTGAFNVKIDEQTKVYLDHLIIAIDEIDNCIDDLPLKTQRDSVTESLIKYLSDDTLLWSHHDATPTLPLKIQNLKAVVRNLDVQTKFIEAAKAIFLNTEIKRHTTSINDFIQYVTLEGKATAILPLSILGVSNHSAFNSFFTKLCMLMGVTDLIFDARSDYRKKYTVLKPSLSLYLRLIKITVKEGCKLIWNIPSKAKFLVYCIKFSLALMRE